MSRTKGYLTLWAGILTAVIFLGACATFKGDIPLEGEETGDVYISPANQDGIQDFYKRSVEIPEVKGLKPAGYRISVLSHRDVPVYEVQGGAESAAGGIKGIFKKKPAVQLPEEIIWDGRDNQDNLVSDGLYYLTVSAWDYSGNKGELPAVRIIVDNTAPSARVTLPYTIFSPNGDGNQDELTLFQESSAEDLWEGTITDKQGNDIRTFSWNGIAPNFNWNGENDGEAQVPEGTYSYRLSSRDRAGNTFEKSIPDLSIDRRAFAISITPSLPAFSPNNDGVKDEVSFLLETDKTLQVLNGKLEIVDETGAVQREMILTNLNFPQSVIYNGRGNTGILLPNGTYFGRFTVVFSNGSRPEAVSTPVLADRMPPHAVLSKNIRVFSPDGDGRKDTITVNQTTSVEETWKGTILSAAGKIVRENTWNHRALSFEWDGRDAAGNVVPDGEYYYSVSSTDLAGNYASYNLSNFVVDTAPTPVDVINRSVSFSPNGDGVDDYMEFELKPRIVEGIIGWNYSIMDMNNREIFRFEGQESIPSTIAWQGTDKDGKIVEGKFQGKLEVEYDKGNLGTAELITPFTLDLTPPAVKITLSPLPFSPDGDGENDQLSIKVEVNDNYNVKNWNALILDPTGQPFLSLPSTRFRNGEFIWDGKSASGELVQAASDYSLVVSAADAVGNAVKQTGTIPIDILVIKEGEQLRIIISSIYFKPNTPDYLDVEPVLVQKNLATLDRLGVILKKYADYRILLEGHAVRVYWNDPKRWLTEENDVLLPLSENRAQAIRDALVSRGITASRMTTQGKGGYNPVVPHSDLTNRWKNRRVEFILIKR